MEDEVDVVDETEMGFLLRWALIDGLDGSEARDVLALLKHQSRVNGEGCQHTFCPDVVSGVYPSRGGFVGA